MFDSLFKLKPLKSVERRRVVFASCCGLALSWGVVSSASAQPKALPQTPSASPVLSLGVLDEAKLAQARSDFPGLVGKVLPQIVAQRHLALIVSQQGVKWDTSRLPRVDVTADALRLLQKFPVTAGALTATQANSARAAFQALDGLKVATTIGGLSYEDYNTRLTNASIAFSAAIRGVPPGALHDQLIKALQAYVDAKTKWDEVLKLLELKIMTFDARTAQMQQLAPESMQAQLYLDQKAKREKMVQETYAPLFDAWEKAGQQVDTAEKRLPTG